MLVRDTFELVGRRWRDLGEFAIVGAAGFLVAFVLLFLGLNALFGGEFFSKVEELSSPAMDSADEMNAWLESFDVTPTTTAVVLLFLFLFASVVGYEVQNIAVSNAALDDLEGREVIAGSVLARAFRRTPKVFLFGVLVGVAIGLAACGGCALMYLIDPALSILWALMVLPFLIVFAPLVPILMVMAYVEPKLPTPRRWLRLMKGNKAALWGRMMLIVIVTGVFSFALSLSLGALPMPALYGELIANVIIAPIMLTLSAVAYLLMYADLTGRNRSPAEPELST